MTTARLAALKARVAASTKINSQAKAENEKLKLELKGKQEEYAEVLMLKKETLESLSGAMYEAENTQLRTDIAVKEAAILKEMAAIEAMLSEGEEVELPPVPEVKPQPKVEKKVEIKPVKPQAEVKPEMNGKKPVTPPDDGGAGWCLIEEEDEDPEDENQFFAPEDSRGWTWESPEEDADGNYKRIPVEFWGAETGVTQLHDSKWSTHFRVVKR